MNQNGLWSNSPKDCGACCQSKRSPVIASQENIASTLNKCAFGPTKSPMSGEDLWPRWLSKMLRREHGTTVFHSTIFSPRTGAHKTAIAQRLNLQADVVCLRCNTTWMSRAENAAKPVLTSLINNPRTLHVLTLKERRAIAAWLAIKAVVLDHLAVRDYGQLKPFFSPQQRTAMRVFQKPPTRTRVYIGRLWPPEPGTTGGDFKTMYYSNFPAQSHDHLRAFVVTISAHELVIQLVASKMAQAVPLVPVPFTPNPITGNWSDYAPQIWPDIGDVLWPTAGGFKRFDALAFRVNAQPGS
jgi:hypothetical protein